MSAVSKQEQIHDLPESVQEIAEVIGRAATLKLIGAQPRAGRRSWRVNIYIPKRLPPDHQLVRVLGWADANRLSNYFGGEILQPSNCRVIEREFRNRTILKRHSEGLTPREISNELSVPYDTVKKLIWSRGKAPVANHHL